MPKRPNGEEPTRAQPRERGRRRSQSRRRDHTSQATSQAAQSEGIDVWQYWEDLENQRRYELKALNSARKELTDKGKITDELKEGLKEIQEDFSTIR
jgi:hypothetical protein